MTSLRVELPSSAHINDPQDPLLQLCRCHPKENGDTSNSWDVQ